MTPPPHARPAPTRHRWLRAAVAGTLYALALLAMLHTVRTHATRHRSAPRTPGENAAATLAAALPDDARRSRRASAFLVARAADCSANFDFLDLFERPPVRERLRLAGVLALGDASAAAALHHALAPRGHTLPVWPASPTLRVALAALGHHATPSLVVVDGDGALRFAIGAPESVRQYLALAATLPLVGDSDTATTTTATTTTARPRATATPTTGAPSHALH